MNPGMGEVVLTGNCIAGGVGVEGPDDPGVSGPGYVLDLFHAAGGQLVGVGVTTVIVGEDQLQGPVSIGTTEDGSAYLAVAILPGFTSLAFQADAFVEGKPAGGPDPAVGEAGSVPVGVACPAGQAKQRCRKGEACDADTRNRVLVTCIQRPRRSLRSSHYGPGGDPRRASDWDPSDRTRRH